ncbi:copper-binding protein [Paucibacter sp. JuS9]|uniref:copper-binding protein n=1 Tax=Paucibacter sp. JuS9 TaxID=3228748 RepID=UPI003756AA6A
MLNRRHLLGSLVAAAVTLISSAGVAEPLASDPIRGEVVKIDQERGTVELKHEPIPYLHLPAKRTIFRYHNPNVVLRAKNGDRVIFRADRYDGTLVVTGPMIPLPK